MSITTLEELAKKVEELAKDIDNVKEAFRIYCDACDAGSTQLRRNLGTAPQEFHRASGKPSPTPVTKYDTRKIVWISAQGDRGPFLLAREAEQISDENKKHLNLLLEILKSTRKSIFTSTEIIWMMKDEKAVGRKRREPTQ